MNTWLIASEVSALISPLPTVYIGSYEENPREEADSQLKTTISRRTHVVLVRHRLRSLRCRPLRPSGIRSFLLRIHRNECVCRDTSLADGTGECTVVLRKPLVDTGPTVHVATAGDHRLFGNFHTDTALELRFSHYTTSY